MLALFRACKQPRWRTRTETLTLVFDPHPPGENGVCALFGGWGTLSGPSTPTPGFAASEDGWQSPRTGDQPPNVASVAVITAAVSTRTHTPNLDEACEFANALRAKKVRIWNIFKLRNLMAYEAPIQRTDPTVLLFLVDQSSSMADRMAGSERTKAQIVADVLNKTLMQQVTRCTKADGVRDYFDIGVIGYGDGGARHALGGNLSQQVLNPISAIEANPVRVEGRRRKVDDGAGGIVARSVKFPVCFEPHANGGTPMCAAFGTEISQA